MIRLARYSLILILFSTPNYYSQKLSSYNISGNVNFEKQDYINWSGIRLNQNYFNGIVDTIKSRIVNNLLKQGYYFAEIKNLDLSFASDSSNFDLHLNVDEGNPVVINKIYFNLSDSSSQSFISKEFDYLTGRVFIKDEIEYSIEKLLINYENSGYPFAKFVIKSVDIYSDSTSGKNLADIYLDIETGFISRIDKVEISGNNSTKDYVIIRELRINPGEVYNQNRIEEFPKRLNRLRFFEPVQMPSFYFNSSKEGILKIDVKEKNTNSFDGIIGYIPAGKNESSGYVTGLVNISLRNLFGTGRAAAIKWNKYNRNSQELDLKYLEPWFLGFPFNINLGLYQRVQDTTYVQRKIEGSVEYLATEDISASLLIASETVVPTIRTIPVFTVYNSSYLTTGVNLKIDTRDDPYSPTKGLLFNNSYSYTRKKINGPAEYITSSTVTSVDLQRFTLSFYIYYELFSRQVLAIGVNGRELRGSSFENSDLYRLGGTNSLRGYREDQFLGSRVLWTNLEYRALFTRRSFGFVFFDTGYYLRQEDEERKILKSEDLLYGFGLGLNLETGLGVLRVSYALGKGDTFSDGKIHFGILNEF